MLPLAFCLKGAVRVTFEHPTLRPLLEALPDSVTTVHLFELWADLSTLPLCEMPHVKVLSLVAFK